MADYDVTKAFEAIEKELIDSMMRNFKRHRAEETKEGYNWTQWQAEQLKSLTEYRKSNSEKFSKQFSNINNEVAEMLKTAKADGNASQELKILEALKNNTLPVTEPNTGSVASFFKTNDRKLNSLINATTNDLSKAEHAVLRKANDSYRKAIFNAQVYANTGAGTYEKAVDMACRDMLKAGLNCVEYKNGARHTLSDYADMAIKTANKRAYLLGEGEKRKEFGITTVVINSRQGGCPKCSEHIGKVYIDDVYSGGKKSDGEYPLLSEAIAGGLFHPRCKDSTSTYYEGITTLEKPVTQEEKAEMSEREQIEIKKGVAERNAKGYARLEKYSLDEDNKRINGVRAKEWENKAEKFTNELDYMSNNFKPEFGKETYLTIGKNEKAYNIPVKQVKNSQFNIVTDVENTRRNKAVRLTEKLLSSIKDYLPNDFNLPQIAVIDFENAKLNQNAIGGFDRNTGVLYLNSNYNTTEKILEYVNKQKGMFANNTEYAPLLHELGHKYYYDSINLLAKSNNISYNKAKEIIDTRIYDYIHSNELGSILTHKLSGYAQSGYDANAYTEIVAECFSVRDKNNLAKDIFNLMR